jgi:quercetin dioxygenase-like cupin family protein
VESRTGSWIAGPLILGLWMAVGTPLLSSNNAGRADPEETVLYQTAAIRVRRTVYPPGRHLAMHEHKGRVVVFLSDGTVRTATPDGKSSDLAFHRGMVYWSDPVRHTLDNVGGTPLDALEVEFLAPYPSTAQRHTGDAAAQDPAHFKVELENERVRVLRFNLGPHDSSPMHDHLDHFHVALLPLHARETLPDGSQRGITEPTNNTGFAVSERHALENLSDQPCESISIEFKASRTAQKNQ